MALNLMISEDSDGGCGKLALAGVAWFFVCAWGLENGHDWLCYGSAGIFMVGGLFIVLFGDPL